MKVTFALNVLAFAIHCSGKAIESTQQPLRLQHGQLDLIET
jgi:hypothetical protein